MSKIFTICHLADIHNRKSPTRNEEYEQVFENLYKSLREKKPDRIVIVGDIVHEYLELSPSQIILVYQFLAELSKITKVRITRGNHDILRSNLNRTDSIEAIVKTLNNPDIVYYDKTGFYEDENVIWAVWHHGEKNNNPWKLKEVKDLDSNKTIIDLFHNPVYGCKTSSGYLMKDTAFYKTSDFKGNFGLFGDIHKKQFLNKEKTKAYSGSLIAQDYSEGDDEFHGYLLWNLSNNSVEEIPIYNEFSFKTIKITQYVDFNDLNFEIENPTKFMRIKFDWNTLPQTRNNENERKLVEYIKSKYDNILTISNKSSFIENDKIEIKENHTLQNISNTAIQHEIFREYLEKIGVSKEIINDVVTLDDEIFDNSNFVEDSNIEWDIVKFGGKNFMSYSDINVDWRDKTGLFQILGPNTGGKTTIFKIITYILFNKTLETETRIKNGDVRYVNNRNGAKSTECYMVIEANGEYYGITRKTEIIEKNNGEIKTPTTVNYYILNSPDDIMDENTSINNPNLDESRKIKTQKKIELIIGSYDNFMRIVLTTSDTLNNILSNDMAVFTDSLLYDSGLDIFDKKLVNLKSYEKRVNEKQRLNCNVESLTTEISELEIENNNYNNEIKNIESVILLDIRNNIKTYRTNIEDLNKKLFKIDPEIYNLRVDSVNYDISVHQKKINELKGQNEVLNQSIKSLKDFYDEKKLNNLIENKEIEKQKEYQLRLKIKEIEQEIQKNEHAIEIINGDVFRLKNQGTNCKKNILELRESKICPTCGQALTDEHQIHIDEKIKIIEVEMYNIANQIKTKENIDKPSFLKIIEGKKNEILSIKQTIEKNSLAMEVMLKEIGTLENDKNDVEKRKTIKNEIDQIPLKIKNEELQVDVLCQKIINYNNSLIQIEENKKIENEIQSIKIKLIGIEQNENTEKENVFEKRTNISNNETKIKNNNQLIVDFKVQEHRDTVINLYKKCVHRDGIPRQMLTNYIIPKINSILNKILSESQFKVWLDLEDLRPKLVYSDIPTAVIDCISASGKERTFSSAAIKFVLNQINVKSKPKFFILDEVTGKLTEESLNEWIEILKQIKINMKRVLVIEQRANLDSDYFIEVSLDENRISSLTL